MHFSIAQPVFLHQNAIAGPSSQQFVPHSLSNTPTHSYLSHPSIPPSTSPSPLLLATQIQQNLTQETPPLSPVESQFWISNKRRRLGTGYSRQSSLAPAPWGKSDQARFDSRLARMTASCGFSFTWIEDIEVQDFMADFIPNAILPGCRVVSDRLVPEEVDKYRRKAQDRSRGSLATLQCDGWTGGNHHHLLAFMMTTSGPNKREVCTLNSN